MELFRVVVEYADLLAERQDGIPPRKRVTYYAAVFGAYREDMIAKAGSLALDAVVGKDADPDKWQQFVVSAELIGSVAVEMRDD